MEQFAGKDVGLLAVHGEVAAAGTTKDVANRDLAETVLARMVEKVSKTE